MGTRFVTTCRLADSAGDGLNPYVNESGAFLGLGTPLLERDDNAVGRSRWRPRPRAEIERLLSIGYGMPVDLGSRMSALQVVADAISSGEPGRAATALLHVRLPALPDISAARRMADGDPLAKYNPTQPRVPRGYPGGGQWTTEDYDFDAGADTTPGSVIEAQATIVEPMEIIRPIPFPNEISPFPLTPTIPHDVPRQALPVNPYPRRRKCVEEWDHAYEFCDELEKKGTLGQGDYRNMGKTYRQCLLGQVSEECGGNRLDTSVPNPIGIAMGKKMRHVDIDMEGMQRIHHIMHSDPRRCLDICNAHIRANPTDPTGYFTRHQVLNRLGRKDHALADLNKSLSLEPHKTSYRARGNLLRSMGEYRKAIDDFDRAEAMDPAGFEDAFGHLFRADCHARLGNKEAALADCAKLRDDHWTPGLLGAPAGNKDQVIAEIHRLVAVALQHKS